MSTSFQDIIHEIIADRIHGSTYLLRKIINVLTANKLSLDELTWSFNQLNSIENSMVVIHHFLQELKPTIGDKFRQRAQQYQSKWEHVNIDIASNLEDYLPDKKLNILAHSHSGVIIAVLMHLFSRGYLINVIQTASEPGGEGHVQAKAIKQLGIDVRIIKDENLSSSIAKVDCCFLGVDQYDEKSFVNKLGSKAIVEAAVLFNKPVYVLSDSRKNVNNIEVSKAGSLEKVPQISNVHLIGEKKSNK